jgi:pyruvate dehydrogenase E2 component (dihydrolipoamide acetyltransferase)
MPVEVTLPNLGESVDVAVVSRWLRFPGDHVAKDEPLLEVSTDKVDTEITSPASGLLQQVLAAEGDEVAIGGRLGFIDDGVQAAADEPATNGPTAVDPADPDPKRDGVDSVDAPVDRNVVPATPYVTPLVRRLAAELGVDLTALRGSGLGNRIRKSDVLAAAGAVAPPTIDAARLASDGDRSGHVVNPYLSPLIQLEIARRGLDAAALRGSGHCNRIRLADLAVRDAQPEARATRSDRTEKLTRLRSVIASRMVESLHTSAQLTTVVEVDVTAINDLRVTHGPAFHAAHGVKLSFTSFFLRAVVAVLPDFPALNASLNGDSQSVTYHGDIHLNVAVDTDRGLLAPLIRNAQSLDIAQFARATANLADLARSNAIGVDDLTAGTFTVTNTGSRGALFDTPIINQPQVAILGTGCVVARATVVRDQQGVEVIEIRNMVYLALTYDHRLIDGAKAADFLCAVKSRLEGADFIEELGVAGATSR